MRTIFTAIAILIASVAGMPALAQVGATSNTQPVGVSRDLPLDQRARDSTNNATRATPQITVTPPPAAACAASTVNWTQGAASCSAAYAGGASGASSAVADGSAPETGSATVSCTNGATSISAASCVAASTNCPAQAVNWTVSGQTCSGTSTSLVDGGTTNVIDGTAPSTGNADYSCSGGTLTQMAGATCTTAAVQCAAGAKTWSVGANSCSAYMPAQNSGAAITLMDVVDPVIGQADFSCSNGTTTTSNATCWVNGGTASCPSQTVNWTVSGNSCSGTYAGGAHGSSLGVTDSAAPVTGSASVSCSDGAVSVTPGSCAATSSACSAQTVNWTVGANSCSANYAGGAHGASSGLTDSTAPAVGSVTATCNNGSVSTSGASCAVATSCAAGQALNWTVSGGYCTGTSSSTTSGNTISVPAGGTNNGSATFQCQSNGTYSYVSGTCGAGGAGDGGASCGSAPAGSAWQASGNICSLGSASPATLLSGQQWQTVDDSGALQGSATIQCSNGTITVVNSSCTAMGPTPTCQASGANLSWTIGASQCLVGAPASDAGAIIGVLDNNTTVSSGTAGSTGDRQYVCNGSNSWSAYGGDAGRCTGSTVMCPATTMTWNGATTGCSGSIATYASGTSFTVTNTASSKTGSATYTCQANGAWSAPSGAVCNAQAVGCPAITTTQWWSQGGGCASPGNTATCCSAPAGNLPALADGGSTTYNDTSDGATGRVITSCSNGTRQYPELSCTLPPPPSCSIPAYQYQESSLGCNVGTNNWNLALTLTQGSSGSLTFSGTTTRTAATCTTPGAGAPYFGFTLGATSPCN